jgi:S1-C subfamily serine protease
MSRPVLAYVAAALLLAGPSYAQRPESDARRAEPDLRRSAVVRAVEQIGPSVVNISAERLVRRRASALDFFGAPGDRSRRSESLGSGVVLDGSGSS